MSGNNRKRFAARVAAVVATSLAASLMLISPAFSAYGTASWIDAGGEGKYVIVDLDNGVRAKVYHGTFFSMQCWYDEVLHRRFYGEVRSGYWAGNKGNVAADFVKAQGPTPPC
ncbi:hypothetical protein [Amycolatopsis sp. 195334CR]|uniref:hypothetical protein n=1 Tax=Amycolatopsis sp. 195334CR TaxID=2814588 RepID=UPI001A8CF94B|nr:hypothetical protein [Amycolatopsis sp. 195334CR]MBN6041145.1 hypothetical protein [Amycolatopsis sp. 195334CR]